MKTVATAFLLVLLSPACLLAGPLTDSAVMLYRDGEIVGSGVVITFKARPYILTAAHVADEFLSDGRALPVVCKTRSGKVVHVRKGTVASVSKDSDLALIEPVDSTGLVPLPLLPRDVTPDEGDDCWYCGMGAGVPWNLVKSIVNDNDDYAGESRPYYRVNGAVWFGHSGSGLLVKHKGKLHVAGVIVAIRGANRGELGFAKLPGLAETNKSIYDYLRGVR